MTGTARLIALAAAALGGGAAVGYLAGTTVPRALAGLAVAAAGAAVVISETRSNP